MSELKYTLPGLDAWTFKTSGYGGMLWHRGGAGVEVNGFMTSEQIAEQVKAVLRQTVLEPDLAAEDSAGQAVMNIDWAALLNPYSTLTAPLLNAASVTLAPRADNTALVDQICALVRKLAA